MDLFCDVEDTGGRGSEQENMGKLGVDRGDYVVLRWWKEARYLVEGEYQELEEGNNGEQRE